MRAEGRAPRGKGFSIKRGRLGHSASINTEDRVQLGFEQHLHHHLGNAVTYRWNDKLLLDEDNASDVISDKELLMTLQIVDSMDERTHDVVREFLDAFIKKAEVEMVMAK